MENRIVIIGGGFAGVGLARALEKQLPADVPIVLLSEENFLLFSPLLSEVVGASILPGHCVAPVRQLLGRTEFLRVRVTGIDRERREVFYGGHETGHLRYGQLVIACGVRANLGMIPGMAEHAFPLKTLGDALELRNRVLLQLERAQLAGDAVQRRRLLSFAVVGGGSSGVEVAGALHDLLTAASRFFPGVEADQCRVTVIEARDRLLPEFSPDLAAFAQRHMQRRGIGVRLGVAVAGVDAKAVHLPGGEQVDAGTTVCTIGAVPQPLSDALDLAKEKGFIKVGADLAVAGAEHIWALGDCASVPNAAGGRAPPTAQFAEREARHLADNIRRRLQQRPMRPFGYRPRASLATIGHRRAVVTLFGLNLHGVVAWLLWRAVYLVKVPTFLRRFQVFFEWSWQALFPRDVTQFHYQPYRLADGTLFAPRVDESTGGPRREAPDQRAEADERRVGVA